MEHKHEVTDRDRCFYIDPAKDMAVTCEGPVKGLKRGDHGAEVYRFRMPQVIEGHDMSLCNKVEIHYNNIHKDPSTREITVNKSFAEAEGFGADQEDGDTITWTWKPTGDATQLDGKLAFCIRFACLEGAEVTYQKFSGIFDAIPVGDTIHNTEEMAKAYADVLESWRQEIMAQMVTEERVMELVADKITAPAVAKVGQTIVVKAVDDKGRPTEWEAANGPATYIQRTETEAMPATVFEYDGFDNGVATYEGPSTVTFEAGNSYLAIIDDVTYEGTAYDLGGSGLIVVGNVGLITPEFPDSGENFLIAQGLVAVRASTAKESVTVSAHEVTETIKSEYLPGVCLPVVEVSTPYIIDPTAPVALTREESNLFIALNGCPAIIKFNIQNTGPVQGVFSALSANEITMYALQLPEIAGGGYIFYGPQDGLWYCGKM